QATLQSLEELKANHAEFTGASLEYCDYEGPLFKSSELGHYQLLPGFGAARAGAQPPAAVRSAAGTREMRHIGAYPPAR
ncbi:MAG TPA: hypothetical protein PLF89_14635, partial [bacterium]|nr:hypothetical protein [bacterium]